MNAATIAARGINRRAVRCILSDLLFVSPRRRTRRPVDTEIGGIATLRLSYEVPSSLDDPFVKTGWRDPPRLPLRCRTPYQGQPPMPLLSQSFAARPSAGLPTGLPIRRSRDCPPESLRTPLSHRDPVPRETQAASGSRCSGNSPGG